MKRRYTFKKPSKLPFLSNPVPTTSSTGKITGTPGCVQTQLSSASFTPAAVKDFVPPLLQNKCYDAVLSGKKLVATVLPQTSRCVVSSSQVTPVTPLQTLSQPVPVTVANDPATTNISTQSVHSPIPNSPVIPEAFTSSTISPRTSVTTGSPTAAASPQIAGVWRLLEKHLDHMHEMHRLIGAIDNDLLINMAGTETGSRLEELILIINEEKRQLSNHRNNVELPLPGSFFSRLTPGLNTSRTDSLSQQSFTQCPENAHTSAESHSPDSVASPLAFSQRRRNEVRTEAVENLSSRFDAYKQAFQQHKTASSRPSNNRGISDAFNDQSISTQKSTFERSQTSSSSTSSNLKQTKVVSSFSPTIKKSRLASSCLFVEDDESYEDDLACINDDPPWSQNERSKDAEIAVQPVQPSQPSYDPDLFDDDDDLILNELQFDNEDNQSSGSVVVTSQYSGNSGFGTFSQEKSVWESSRPPLFRGVTDEGQTGYWDGIGFPHSEEVDLVFRTVFGLREFRPNQLQAINAALMGHDTFIIMPTGGGKSLCYQLPAVVQTGVTVVVSPLKALIVDQVSKLQMLGIAAEHLSGDPTVAEVNKIYMQLSMRQPTLKLLYVTPEKLTASEKLTSTLGALYRREMLCRIVIDEAHCVSQWGHDFRPDYKQLKNLRVKFPNVPIMALTATANAHVRADVTKELQMVDAKRNDPRSVKLFINSFNRPNLKYMVLQKRSKLTEDIVNLINRDFPGQSGIIYCLSRKETEDVAAVLSEAGLPTLHYHAGLSDYERANVQRRWLNEDRCKIICATIAFGMGIDKPDVRFVIHYSIPKSVEGYYQEAGRAGRDGLLASCILYYAYKDVTRMRKIIECDESVKDNKTKALHLDNLYRMVHYCENAAECRRLQILDYFGQIVEGPLDLRCNEMPTALCDNCKSKDAYQMRDVTADAIQIVLAVQRCGGDLHQIGKFTMLQFIDAFRGSVCEKIKSSGLIKDAIHGIGKSYSKCEAERLFRWMVIQGILAEKLKPIRFQGQDHFACYLTVGKFAADVVARKRKVQLAFCTTKRLLDIQNIGTEAAVDSLQKLKDDCYHELLNLIREIARDMNVNYTTIYNNDIIRKIADSLPADRDQLLDIPGMTRNKLDTSLTSPDAILTITQKYNAQMKDLNLTMNPGQHIEDFDDFVHTTELQKSSSYRSQGSSYGRKARGRGGKQYFKRRSRPKRYSKSSNDYSSSNNYQSNSTSGVWLGKNSSSNPSQFRGSSTRSGPGLLGNPTRRFKPPSSTR